MAAEHDVMQLDARVAAAGERTPANVADPGGAAGLMRGVGERGLQPFPDVGGERAGERPGAVERFGHVDATLGVAALPSDGTGLVHTERVEQLVDEPGDLLRRVVPRPADQV